MSHWNYRVLQSFDQTEYFIAEVYFDDEGKTGWVDNREGQLKWDDYDDLKGTVELLLKAFDRPVMRVVEGDNLIEIEMP